MTSPLTTDTKKRHSLHDILEADDAAKHNSDMANLASALRAAKENKDIARQTFEHLTRVEEDIRIMAGKMEAGEEMDMREVRKLYDLAYRRGGWEPTIKVR